MESSSTPDWRENFFWIQGSVYFFEKSKFWFVILGECFILSALQIFNFFEVMRPNFEIENKYSDEACTFLEKFFPFSETNKNQINCNYQKWWPMQFFFVRSQLFRKIRVTAITKSCFWEKTLQWKTNFVAKKQPNKISFAVDLVKWNKNVQFQSRSGLVNVILRFERWHDPRLVPSGLNAGSIKLNETDF